MNRGISVLDPFSPALEWTRSVLFQPFRPVRWLIIGFTAWLARLGQGGGGGFNWNVPSDDIDPAMSHGGEWVAAHLAIVLGIVGVLLVLLAALIIVVTWVSSRGKFMFLDNVVYDREAVVDPWRRYARAGNSVFKFRLILGLSALAFFILLASGVGSVLFAGTRGGGSPGLAVIGLIVIAILIVLAAAFTLALVGVALNDFVVPIVFLREKGVMDGWRVFRKLLADSVGVFVLYALFRILIGLCTVVIGTFAVCCTCCLAALPYVGTVLLLPLHVFVRSYSVFFLRQFGPEFEFFAPTDAAPPGSPSSPGPVPSGSPSSGPVPPSVPSAPAPGGTFR